MIATIQLYLFLGLALVGFAIEVWAFVDVLRRPASGFEAADKRTKGFWLAIVALAVVIGFLGIPPPLGISGVTFFILIAVVPAGIYLADVRPAVARYSRGPRGGSRW